MADNNLRSYRNRDPSVRSEAEHTISDEGDPLAELARLIGQSDPYAESRRSEAYRSGRSGDNMQANPDAATDQVYAEKYEEADDRYALPQATPAAAPYPPYSPEQIDRSYEPAAGGRYFSEPASRFGGFREEEETDTDYRNERAPVLRSQELPGYASEGPDNSYETDQPEHDAGEAYTADDGYDEPPRSRRRHGLVVVMAVFALAVVGTAGAFAYRSMFGSVLPSLPPIIKASNGPNKIVPNYGESQPNNPDQTGVASAGSTEHLVSREEQPVNMDAPTDVPRVVSTIPIGPGQNTAQPGAAAPVAPPSAALWPDPDAAATPWPNPPAPALSSPGGAPSMPTAQPTSPPSGAPNQVSTEPRRVHTVLIRADQASSPDAAPAQQPEQPSSPPPALRTASRRASAAPPPTRRVAAASERPQSGSHAPLSIVPGARGEAVAPAPARMREAAVPMSVASASPVRGAPTTSSSGGGYAVQVTSRRTEAEAQAAFRELRAKFPNQLSGREPIIRRADLGARGTYYRALVGPFASMEQAAGMCSGLKAAGGNCLVQRN